MFKEPLSIAIFCHNVWPEARGQSTSCPGNTGSKADLAQKSPQGAQVGTAAAACQFLQRQSGLFPRKVYPYTAHLPPGCSSIFSLGISFLLHNSLSL